MINCFTFNLLSSALGTTNNGRNFPRINTSPVEILSADVSEPPSSQVKLEISKTEKHRNNNILAEEAAQIFDDKIPVQQKAVGFFLALQGAGCFSIVLECVLALVADSATFALQIPTIGIGTGLSVLAKLIDSLALSTINNELNLTGLCCV